MTAKKDEKDEERANEPRRGPHPSDPSGTPIPVGPPMSAPSADFTLAAQTSQYDSSELGRSALHSMASKSPAAVHAEEVAREALVEAADPAKKSRFRKEHTEKQKRSDTKSDTKSDKSDEK